MNSADRPWTVAGLLDVMRNLKCRYPLVSVSYPSAAEAPAAAPAQPDQLSIFGVQVKINPAIPPGHAVMQGARGDLAIIRPDGAVVHVPGWDSMLIGRGARDE